MSASGVTRAMIADFNSLQAGLIFDASHVTPGDNETSEQSPTTSDFKIRSAQDPIGYTKATPDPKHQGQAMRSSMCTEWIKSQNLEMQGPWSRGVFQKVLRTSFCPQDKVFSTHFHYRVVPAHRNCLFDPASEFLSTHR